MRLLRPALLLPAVAILAAAGAAADDVRLVASSSLSAIEAQVLLGKTVRTRDGHPAGRIRDFTLAGPDGRLDQCVLTSGGILGFGATTVAVPVEKLRVGATDRVPAPGEGPPMQIILDLTAEELAATPGFVGQEDAPTLVGRR